MTINTQLRKMYRLLQCRPELSIYKLLLYTKRYDQCGHLWCPTIRICEKIQTLMEFSEIRTKCQDASSMCHDDYAIERYIKLGTNRADATKSNKS